MPYKFTKEASHGYKTQNLTVFLFYFQIYDTPESTRPKKWSSKLKLNSSGSTKSSEKSPESPYMYGTISGPGASSLSKQMKYMDPWLYGSVRAQNPPGRPSVFQAYPEGSGPVLISTPQKPTPHNYAVILCSCTEYLNGTKKTSSTKVSICKKCKGSRLPLTLADSPRLLVGGTVRGPQVSRDTGLLRSGTVRVPGSKARPTILKSSGDQDPYDLMRRNRLAPPHETRIGSQFATSRSRAKSISPCRVKTKRQASEAPNKGRSKSVSRVNEVWVEEDSNSSDSKKSILSCDINPYDLVKSSSSSKSLVEFEFDDEFGDVFHESLKKKNFKSINKSKSDSNVKAIGGQRIRVSDESNTCNIEEVSAYETINYDLKTFELKTQEVSPTLSLPNIKNENKKTGSLSKNSSKKILNISTSNRTKQKSASPKRPPRRIRNIKTDDDSESDNQRLPERNNRKSNNDTLRLHKSRNPNNDTIKSILKKPRIYDSIGTTTKIENSDDSFDSKRVNSSLFYIPKPKDKGTIAHNILQRKRVQFLVESNEETKVIYTAEFNLEQTVVRAHNPVVEIEEEVIAEGDIVSQSLNQNETDELTALITQEKRSDNSESDDKLNNINEQSETTIEETIEESLVNEETINEKLLSTTPHKEGKFYLIIV